jgi:hypothetical protein
MMKRLLLSSTGVILTFAWIIYTAPDSNKPKNPSGVKIKIINKSGLIQSKQIESVANASDKSIRAEQVRNESGYQTLRDFKYAYQYYQDLLRE